MEPAQYDLLYQCEETLWWFEGMRQIASALLGPRLRPGISCLDAGCGTGFNARFFERAYGWRVTALDRSLSALSYARSRGAERLTRASVSKLPFRSASFDGAVCFDVLFCQEPEEGAATLAELHRILFPGGFLLVRTAALPWLSGRHSREVHERHRYRLSELTRVMAAQGLHVDRATYANTLLLPLAALKRRVLEPLGLARSSGDVHPVAAPLNRTLGLALKLEEQLMRIGVDLPVGVSALVLATKPS